MPQTSVCEARAGPSFEASYTAETAHSENAKRPTCTRGVAETPLPGPLQPSCLHHATERVRAVFEVWRFVPVRVKIRLHVTRFVSRESDFLSACHACRDLCVSLCFCVSLRVMHVACHACRVSMRVNIIACHACRVSCVSGSVAVRFVSVSGSCVFAVRVCFCASLRILRNLDTTRLLKEKRPLCEASLYLDSAGFCMSRSRRVPRKRDKRLKDRAREASGMPGE
jgi:hypothetical protein